MATKKDLVEAYAFSRRRLVTAFVSGAPGGREVEPARPGRTIVGGLALAVLLAAGAAIAGVFAPRTPTDWLQSGLIVSKETGQAYVILGEDGELPEEDEPVELRPVINITSARLILGPDVEPTLISQSTIDDQQVGEDIGILGAPATLTAPDLLLETGWTSCTADGAGMRVRVASNPGVAPADGRQLLVRSQGDYWLVAQPPDDDTGAHGAYAYRVPPQVAGRNDRTDTMLTALDAGSRAAAVKVPRDWLNLFPAGGDLDWSSFELDRVGERADGAGDPGSGIPQQAEIGDVLTSESEGSVLLTDDGPADLDPFALAVYENIETPRGFVDPIAVDTLPSRGFGESPFEDTHWPSSLLTELGDTDPCAQLVTADDEVPTAQLAQTPDEDAAADGVAPGRKVVAVDPGRGAFVLSGSWEDPTHGSPYVVDAKGRANPLSGADAVDQLGYADYPVPVVPDSWMSLFDDGVELSTDAALCPPAEPGTGGASCE